MLAKKYAQIITNSRGYVAYNSLQNQLLRTVVKNTISAIMN